MAPRDHNTLGDWQPNCSKVKKRTVHLHISKEWSDCTFQFESIGGPNDTSLPLDTIQAHKLILAMASPVFAAQFFGSLVNEEPISVKDIDRSTFGIMLRYIYTDDIEVYSVREAIDVYYAAKKYILPYLQEDCVDFLLRELSPHNVCRIYEFSLFHDEHVLKQKCLKLFSKKTLNVLKSSHFCKAKIETVKQIVSMNHLNIHSELDLFNALLRYSDQEVKNAAIAENMATTICSLYEKHMTKGKQSDDRSDSLSSDSSSSSASSDSDVEERPILSSVIVSKNTYGKSQEDDKGELVRKSLRPCVQQVRFLTLNPREFAECSGLNSLLANEEIMAIAMNIASKDTAVPMPEGFSKSLVPRNQHHSNPVAAIRFTVNNIAQVKKFTSEVFCARHIPWSITVLVQEKRKSNSEERQLYLRLFVDCLLQREGGWSVAANYTIRTILSIVNNQSFDLPLQKHVYCFTNEQKRSSHLYHWNTPTPTSSAPAPRPNISHATTADNSITFEVKIEPGRLRIDAQKTTPCLDTAAAKKK